MASDLDALIEGLIDGDRDRSLRIVADLAGGGMSPVDIVTGGVETAMAALDRKCTAEQFNLLEIMLAGRAVMGVIRHLFPEGRSCRTRQARWSSPSSKATSTTSGRR